ncbi:MAG: hypothetical protein D6732_19900, partial [Methanobacteriota archaeon]
MIFVLIAQSEESFHALSQMVEAASTSIQVPVADGAWANRREMRLWLPEKGGSDAFEDAAAKFSEWVADDVTVLVSGVAPFDMNPLNRGREGILAALILAFPEVRWLFGGIRGYGDEQQKNK